MQCFNDGHLYLKSNQEINKHKQIKIQIHDWYYQSFQDKVYLKIPTFIQSKETDHYIKEYAQLLMHNRNKNIIFDIRGNSGGNSAYISELLSALFGENYYLWKIHQYYTNTYEIFRASKLNIDFVTNFYIKHNITQDLSKLHDCFAKKEKMCKLESPLKKTKYSPSKFNKKIYILIDKKVFSASLNFIDELMFITTPYLVGEETNKDSVYMDINEYKIENMILYFPMKVWRNRLRGSNSYKPNIKIKIDDLMNL